jgi:hypothetical protein
MDDDRDKVRHLQKKVREVLMRDWDPIGVGDVPGAPDEYDSYIGRVCLIVLDDHTTGDKIVTHLLDIATLRMGLTNQPGLVDCCTRAAATLIALRSEFAGSRSAARLAWSRNVAGLIVDALMTAGLTTRETFHEAVDVATEEINARLALDDGPPK